MNIDDKVKSCKVDRKDKKTFPKTKRKECEKIINKHFGNGRCLAWGNSSELFYNVDFIQDQSGVVEKHKESVKNTNNLLFRHNDFIIIDITEEVFNFITREVDNYRKV